MQAGGYDPDHLGPRSRVLVTCFEKCNKCQTPTKKFFLAIVPRNLSREISKIFGQFLLFGDYGKRKEISC